MSTELVNGIYLIKNTGSGKYLNVWGIDQVGNSRNVNQYDLSAELSQVFWVQKTTTGVLKLSSIIKDANGAYYSLNVNTNTFNANLYKETASNDQDSALAFESVGNGNYKIRVGTKYDGNTYFLTALGNVNGTNLVGRVNGNVVWATEAENSAYQVWAFEYMAPYRSTYDIRKLDAQIFLHKFYQSTCEIDAKAGTVLCMELVKALQKILLNISTDDEGYGYFGEKTLAACPTMQTGIATTERNKKLVTLFCHAMFCKGYSTTAIYDSFNANVANGVKKIQADMGMPQTGVVTPLLMKAVFNTDSYVLSSKGDARIREIQQAMNNGYSEYSGINPCDGIYSRATNKALIYAIQKEEGISVENSAPSFGQTTFSLFPTLPFTGDSKETGKNEANITKILQYALYVNAMYAGDFDGVYSATVSEAVQKFQTFMAYPGNTTTYADARVMKGLLASCGDTSRLCTALDTATILTKPVLTNLKNMGIKYVGRYLTGMVKTQEGKRVSKKITRSEAENILAAGLNIIPIYQDGGQLISYFTAKRGYADAKAAILAASELGIPSGATIYFAVDCDPLETQIHSNIVPYFTMINNAFNEDRKYQVGIYGTRNTCAYVSENGLAVFSYVADMSTAFSGNLGYKMPENWAFDQFGSTKVNGVEFDKVGFSGKDMGVSQLAEVGYVSDADKTENAVRSKICDFQEDIAILNALPNVTVGKEWTYSLVDTGNIKIEYTVSVGSELKLGNGDYNFTITDGKMEESGEEKIAAALSKNQKLNESSNIKETITTMFKGMSVSISQGEASLSIEPNTAEGSVKVSLTTSIPELQITDNISTTFSQTIAITIRSKYEKNADTPSEAKELNEAVLVKGFSEKSEEVLGMALAVMSTLLDEKVLETVRDVVVAVTASAVIVMVLKILGTFMEGLVLVA